MKTGISIWVFASLFIVFSVPRCESKDEKNETVPVLVPHAKILNFIDEEDADLESRAGNKSLKILTKPLNPQTTTTPYNPYFMHPYNPGFGDVSAQGSIPQPNLQPPPPPNHNNRQPINQDQSSAGVPDIYVQLIGAIERLVGRMDKLDNRLRTVESILYHMTNKKEELPEQGKLKVIYLCQKSMCVCVQFILIMT